MNASISLMSIEDVKMALMNILKQNDLCCCGEDFLCNNCRLVDQLRLKTDHCCPNCYMVISI